MVVNKCLYGCHCHDIYLQFGDQHSDTEVGIHYRTNNSQYRTDVRCADVALATSADASPDVCHLTYVYFRTRSQCINPLSSRP